MYFYTLALQSFRTCTLRNALYLAANSTFFTAMLKTIGDYEYSSSDVLGSGAFGVVYRGQRKGVE